MDAAIGMTYRVTRSFSPCHWYSVERLPVYFSGRTLCIAGLRFSESLRRALTTQRDAPHWSAGLASECVSMNGEGNEFG